MAYTLTLSKADRDAIDWVGHRYFGGDNLRSILTGCIGKDEDVQEWEDEGDVTFKIPESDAWAIKEGIAEEGLPCFGPELCDKLYTFVDRII